MNMKLNRDFLLKFKPARLVLIIITIIVLFIVVEIYFYFRSTVKVFIDNKTIVFHTRAKNVGELLGKIKIRLNPQDIVIPKPDNIIPYNGFIRIIRVSEKTQELIVPVGERTKKTKFTNNLRHVIIEKGSFIEKHITVNVIYHDDKEYSRKTVREKESYKAIYRLHLIDKKSKKIETTYNLLKVKKRRMVATAYYPGDPLAWKDGTETFLGLKMQRGIVAIDPKVIPLRTRVYVPGFGYGYAGDTGRVIKKNRIDLGVNNAEEEKEWMHKKVTVYILDKRKSW